jgi:multiple sugar transport system permease protein
MTITDTPMRSAAAGSRRRRISFWRRHGAAYILAGPFYVLFLLMLVVPLGYAGYLSAFTDPLVGGVEFVGFGNFIRALTDPLFIGGVGRMFWFLVIQVPIMLALSLFCALALDSGRLRFPRFARLMIFVPYAVPGVVAALMWGYLYGPEFGPLAQVSNFFDAPVIPFLSGDLMLYSIMNIVTWGYVGYNMIVMYSALTAIPGELYEAAQMDGASQWRIAWSIKIPSIRPAILITVIFSVIGTFQLFNEPNLLRTIAPNVIGSSYTPNLYAYDLAFVSQDVNYAAAVAFLLGIVTMAISAFTQLRSRRNPKEAAE